MNVLLFEIEGRRLALPAERVREVARMVAVTPLPGAPGVVEGVVNLRGAIVPVFDLRRRLGLPARAVSAQQHLVFAEAGGRLVALRVDQADTLAEIADDAIAPPPARPGATAGDAVTPHVAGIAATEDGALVIYDLDAFLSAADERSLEDALAAAHG